MSGERLASGTRIGDYVIERELRSEARSIVHAAVHVVLPRRAELELGDVVREACILEALSHPGVPRIYECGALADRRAWIAVERIEGTTLADAARHAPLAIADLVTILRALADILAHAHARGIGHHRLGDGVVVLTPERRTPVCVRGWGGVVTHLAADPTSDVHSLGALAYRALRGAVLREAPADLTNLIDDMLAPGPSAAEVCERADAILLRIRG